MTHSSVAWNRLRPGAGGRIVSVASGLGRAGGSGGDSRVDDKVMGPGAKDRIRETFESGAFDAEPGNLLKQAGQAIQDFSLGDHLH